MSDFDEGLIISLSKLLDQTGLSEIEIENKKVGRIKVAKNITQSYSHLFKILAIKLIQ